MHCGSLLNCFVGRFVALATTPMLPVVARVSILYRRRQVHPSLKRLHTPTAATSRVVLNLESNPVQRRGMAAAGGGVIIFSKSSKRRVFRSHNETLVCKGLIWRFPVQEVEQRMSHSSWAEWSVTFESGLLLRNAKVLCFLIEYRIQMSFLLMQKIGSAI